MRSVMRTIAAMIILYSAQATLTAAQSDVVVVTLRGRVEPTNDTINISDIASVKGGDLVTRRKISQLDLAELDQNATSVKLSKERVNLRILLSGVAKESFVVLGPTSTLLTRDKRESKKVANAASADSRILDFLRAPIASRLNVAPSDVLIRIVRPISDEQRLLFDSELTLDHFLPPSMRSGPQYVKIGFRRRDQLEKTMAVWLDVQVMREVFVANQRLESGTTITETDLTRQRRPVGRQLSRQMNSSPVGRITRKAIDAGAVVTDLDLIRSTPKSKEFVIRNRDTVEILVQRNALQVRLTGGVALQRGAVGDAIRVKNPDSGKVLTARVVDSGSVEIRL